MTPDLSVGQIVYIKRGRDKGKPAIVIGLQNPNFVLLADGRKRKVNRPKKKNIKHVQPTQVVVEGFDPDRVTDELLRDALNQYLLKRKGE